MAAAVEILALLLLGCWAFTSADPLQNCNYNAIVGETFTIPLDVSLKARLRWRTNTEIIYDSRRQTNMFNVNEKGDLILTSVKKEDEGAYIYEIMNSEGVLENPKTVMLCVHDSVQKPNVTHECDKPPGSVTFTCRSDMTEHVTYEWLEGDSNVVIARTKVLTREVQLSGSNSFKCVVSKFTSSKTSDPVKHECNYPLQNCNYNAIVDETFTIPLDVSLKARLRWQKSTQSIYDSRRQTNMFNVNEKGDLILTSVKKEDEGAYIYEIMNSEGVLENTKTIILCVHDSVQKPNVTHECDKPPGSVTFTCRSDMTEHVTYEWLEGDSNVVIARTKVLTRELSGSNSFKCVVSKFSSSKTSDPVKHECKYPLQNCNYNAIVGETFTIPLDVSLKARLQWRTNTEIIYDSRRQTNMFNVNEKGDLILTSVKKEDEGAYIYEIMNSEGVFENTKTITLCVHDSVQKPNVTHECDKPPGSVTFTCRIDMTEHVTYEWLEGDSNVVIGRTKVLTRELSGSNSFKCVVSKFSSSKTSNPVKHECKYPLQNCNYNTIVDETFTIPLDVSLKARLRWKTNTEIIYDSRRQTNMFNVNGKGDLILTSVKKEDEGAYIYEIINSEGVFENTKTITLCVHD